MPDFAFAASGSLPGNPVTVQMMALGLIILAAHLGGKLFVRLRFSQVTGQLIGGALVGPYALHLAGILPGVSGGLYDYALHSFHFFIFVFLSVVAFGIGEHLQLLAGAAHVPGNSRVRESLRAAGSSREFIEVLREVARQSGTSGADVKKR